MKKETNSPSPLSTFLTTRKPRARTQTDSTTPTAATHTPALRTTWSTKDDIRSSRARGTGRGSRQAALYDTREFDPYAKVENHSNLLERQQSSSASHGNTGSRRVGATPLPYPAGQPVAHTSYAQSGHSGTGVSQQQQVLSRHVYNPQPRSGARE